MREILFRGKDLLNDQWIEGYLMKGDYENYVIFVDDVDCFAHWDYGALRLWGARNIYNETAGQFTGLTDKNGKKIFEGDIVIVTTINIDEEDGYGVIDWHEDTARYIVDLPRLIVDFDNLYSNQVEVIGNIHDNPELLKEHENV